MPRRVLASGLVERIGEDDRPLDAHRRSRSGLATGPDAPTLLDATYARELPIPDHTAGFAVMLDAFAENGPR